MSQNGFSLGNFINPQSQVGNFDLNNALTATAVDIPMEMGNLLSTFGSNNQQGNLGSGGFLNNNAVNNSGFNLGNFNLDSIGGVKGIAAILQGLGNAYTGIQQGNLAKDALKFQKGITEQNMAANKKDYNSTLEDKIRTRFQGENRSQEAAEQLINERRV